MIDYLHYQLDYTAVLIAVSVVAIYFMYEKIIKNNDRK